MQVVYSAQNSTVSNRKMLHSRNLELVVPHPPDPRGNTMQSRESSFAIRATMLPKISFRGNALGKFVKEAMTETHPNWEKATARINPTYTRPDDVRTPFERDYTRIIHSRGFARSKGKRQVMLSHTSGENCTRMDHQLMVANVAKSICKRLGLNAELAETMGIAHDMGHTPFGHSGERTIKQIIKDHNIDENFWHEKNGLNFVDNIETLPNPEGKQQNLNLTYAVRDGIICHCGEVDENAIKPRTDFMDLHTMIQPGQHQPATWEGCVVKISDKVSYIGRDIEDATKDGVLDPKKKKELLGIASKALGRKVKNIDAGTVINMLESDLAANSSPEEGLKFSHKALEFINGVKKFNLNNIYIHPLKLEKEKYDSLALNGVFNSLDRLYDGKNTVAKLRKANSKQLASSFEGWLRKYSTARQKSDDKKFNNPILYKIEDKKDYHKSIIHYLSSLTDERTYGFYQETRQTLKD